MVFDTFLRLILGSKKDVNTNYLIHFQDLSTSAIQRYN
ncbi:Putative protein [Zobellia galactanivorans]|uniref:Uncharacterized protein n=1 Tax=Zobellia galactanivorans (strain DSM 12802 / CCUG 47099 / CIP 106680 / NCIMB 13871 / Dsij) TaxID=63186 RepID=G0L9K3_ZOBGA|nr:Putative protein [Zobellia galactanivorans]